MVWRTTSGCSSDPRLHQSLKVTFIYVIVGVPLQLIVALAIAMLLNEGMKGLPFYRSIFYLPSMLGASVAIALIWRQMFESDGLVNQVLRLFGIPATTSWIADPRYALWTLILLHIWTFGSPMVIFLAGLRQIPGMYYEAASVDGASHWAQFRKITLPLLSPIIFFNLVLQIINAFQAFTQAFVVSNGTGGPVGLDTVLHAVPVPAWFRAVPDGLCRRHGLAAGGDHRGLHRDQLLLLKVLGVLR